MTRRRPRKETRIARGRASVLISMQNVELVLGVGSGEKRGGCARDGSLVFSICPTGEPYTYRRDGTVQPLKPPDRVAPLDVLAVRQSKLFASLCVSLCADRIVDSVGHYRTPSTRVPCVVSCVLFAHVALHVA